MTLSCSTSSSFNLSANPPAGSSVPLRCCVAGAGFPLGGPASKVNIALRMDTAALLLPNTVLTPAPARPSPRPELPDLQLRRAPAQIRKAAQPYRDSCSRCSSQASFVASGEPITKWWGSTRYWGPKKLSTRHIVVGCSQKGATTLAKRRALFQRTGTAQMIPTAGARVVPTRPPTSPHPAMSRAITPAGEHYVPHRYMAGDLPHVGGASPLGGASKIERRSMRRRDGVH